MHKSRIRFTHPSQKYYYNTTNSNNDYPRSKMPETLKSPVPNMLEAQRNLVPTGFRFRPSNEELVAYYLFNKIIKNPVNDGLVIDDCDLYGDEPWKIWKRFAGNRGVEELYFFTQLKKKKPNHNRFDRRVGLGQGTWHGEDACSEFKVKITTDKTQNLYIKGFTKRFSYRNANYEQNGAWLMREFSCNLSDDIVLCVLKWNEAAAVENMDEATVQVKLGVNLNPKLLKLLVEPKNVDRKIFVEPWCIEEVEEAAAAAAGRNQQRMMKEEEVESSETTSKEEDVSDSSSLSESAPATKRLNPDLDEMMDLELSLAPPSGVLFTKV